jgi:cathepsin B
MKRLFLYLLLCVGFLMVFAQVSFAGTDDELAYFCDKVENELQRRGASWTAERNRFTDFSLNELTGRFGWLPESEDRDDMPLLIPKQAAADELPEHLDWRDMDGKNYVTPVLEQHPCGSCWATSTLAAVESAIAIRHDLSDPFFRLSIQHLVSECCPAGDCGGGSMFGALEFILNEGVAEEPCFPYRRVDSICEPCDDWQDWSTTISGYVRTDPDYDTEAIMQALQDGPVIAGIAIYLDWIFYAQGVYKHVIGPVVGAHAVLIVGYDQSEQYWIVKNSWGTWWGDEGYILMGWGEADIEGWTARPLYDFDEPVEADFTADKTEACVGQPVSLTNLTTPEADNYFWRFWDGQNSREVNPTHVYDEPGSYTVTLSAWTPGGRSDIRKDDFITVFPAARAEFDVESRSACPQENVAFNNLSEGLNLSYQWDFGDGSTSTEREPSHVYDTPGDYEVTLTTTGDCGAEDTATFSVHVIDIAVDCDDSNPCTDEWCVDSECAHRANSASCDDGIFCNGNEHCLNKQCQTRNDDPCGDNGPCNEESDSCDGAGDDDSLDNNEQVDASADDDGDNDGRCGGLF